jgi:hypothetical protein
MEILVRLNTKVAIFIVKPESKGERREGLISSQRQQLLFLGLR